MQFDIEVNNRIIQARRGDTILATLCRNGIKVPTLCSFKNLSHTGACRICVVEVEGFENLVTSCSYPVQERMVIRTHSPRVLKARKVLVELLLSNHPDDCLYCERNGSCELQDLSVELNIRERRISGRKSRYKIDLSSPSVVSDPAKCILCGRCVRVCDEVQSVATLEFINRGSNTLVSPAMNRNLNFSSCIGCGQCVMVCPTGALHEHSNLDEVQDALNNKSKKVVIQFDPAISVSLAEEFGLKPGKDLSGIVVAALRRIGFDFVFDSTFAADLAVLEIVAELKERIDKSENLPMFSSFCPAWVKYAEQFYPNVIPLLSTCKSPQQIMGTLIKSYFAASQGINQNEIISVAAMPCLARKFEAQRSEMTSKNVSDVDLVLSTRELIRLIRLYGIDIQNIDPNQPDSPFAIRSSAGKLFATAGGSTEAIIRTLHHVITGKEMTLPKITELRSITGVKQVDIQIGKEKYNFIVSSGLTSINKLMESIKSGELNAHFIEIMACPGGCVNGGGQPFRASEKDIKTRSKSIYDIDENETIKFAHNNLMVKELYSKFLEKPGSEKSLMLLHTMFSRREVLL